MTAKATGIGRSYDRVLELEKGLRYSAKPVQQSPLPPTSQHKRFTTWLPLVTVEYDMAGVSYHDVSPILTSMFLRGISPKGLGINSEILDPIQLDLEYQKYISKNRNIPPHLKWSKMDDMWIQTICKALSDAVHDHNTGLNPTAPQIEFQSRIMFGDAGWVNWAKSLNDFRKWGSSQFKAVHCVCVMPVVVRKYDDGEFLHPYNPLTSRAEEVILKKLGLLESDLDPARRILWTGGLKQESHFIGEPKMGAFGIPAILLDAGYRVTNKDSYGVRIQKRMGTQLISTPTLESLFDSESPGFFGDELEFNAGIKTTQELIFPSRAAASRAAWIDASIPDPDSGITSDSYTTEPAVESERGVMFVETWADTRKCLIVNVCNSEPQYYHEFIRCTSCNGQVELLAPEHHIPPTSDCPHCSTANGISWEYRLTGNKHRHGDDANEKNTQ